MGENEKFNRGLCEEKHINIKEKFISVEAEISNASTSINNRLDKVNEALTGGLSDPGGLLRDVKDIKEEFKQHKKDIDDGIEIYEKNIKRDKDEMAFRIKLCLIMCVLVVGGKFLGVGFDAIVKYFKQPDPIVQTVTVEEKPKEIPTEIIKYIDDLLKQQEKNISLEEGE